MGKYFKYLKTVLVHKTYVIKYGVQLDVPIWNLVIHDLTKLYPSEAFPYIEWFYGEEGKSNSLSPSHEQRKHDFSVAWLHHVNHNPHHWQYWIQRDSDFKATKIPHLYIREMLADWLAASKAYSNKEPRSLKDWEWWQEHKDKINLHPDSRVFLEELAMAYFNFII